MKPLLRQVKIQGKWLTAEILHVYAGFGQVWYSLLNDAGMGWATINGIRVVNPNDNTVSFGLSAIERYKL